MRRRWCLCNSMDFQSLMYPSFTWSRILGLFPYKLNASTFEISKPYYIVSTVIICVCGVMNFALIYSIIKSKIDFGDVVWNIHAVIYHFLTSFIVIITHFLSSPRMRLLQTIMEVSSKLPSKSYQKLSRLIHVKDILNNVIRIVQLVIKMSKVLNNRDSFFAILFGIFTIYFALLVLQIITLYINYVCVLKACFKRINDNLLHIQKFVINDLKPGASNVIRHTQRNQFLLIELRVLKKQHLMISDAVQMLNMIFSLQLLAAIVVSFLILTFDLYFFAFGWQNRVFIGMDWHFLDVFLTSLTYNIFQIILIVWVCETGKNQVQEIGTTIHGLLNSTNDEKIKSELQLFSLQVLHRKNTFSVKGLTIDATLLTALVGNITTYFLILIQFLNISNSCDKRTMINITESN
ncbi:PREDICTED: putative gustatory receptor 28b [Trachymyrmex cornetzi]|uniref:putative gustatory receptor 28b n=1 Tax=Trachymyrmex cornetzi TaxID=471704 RepID=UPI00084EEF24|nr:PREDICTED: putative gustatory receptor 28b [Trachymyrmex cornetzi]